MTWFTNLFLQSPWAMGLLALLPAIVVMYLLKLKRQKVTMPSTLLWRRAMQDMVANSPFQRLRNNLLMWLQLLFLLLLILAFWRPVTELVDNDQSTYILMIDHSASMQTMEGTRSRLEMAKEEALTIISTLSNKDQAIVLGFSDRTNILQTLTSDKVALENAINRLESRDVSTSLKEAGLILQSLTSDPRDDGGRTPRLNTKTIVISDGAIAEMDALVDVPNLEYIAIGGESENIGITNVDVRESFADSFEYEVFVSIKSTHEDDQDVLVEFEVDGELIDIKAASIPAGGESGVIFTTAENFDGIATVRLSENDFFELDDEVNVRIKPPQNIEVLLVSGGNAFLEQVLLIDQRVELSMIRPVDYSSDAEYDITFFDNAQIGEINEGNYVFLNSIPPIDGFVDTGEMIQNPEIIDWNRIHPLNRFVNFETVLIGESIKYEAPQTAIPIVETISSDMMTLYETETQRTLVIGFDIFKSYWPLDVSFPIFIANTIDYFARNSANNVKPTYRTGENITLFADRDSDSAIITTPWDEDLEFSFEGTSTAYLTDTINAGIYTYKLSSGTEIELPVNLLSYTESDITPTKELNVADNVIVSNDEATTSNQEIWHWFVLAALLIMLLEWIIYTKRTFM